MSQTLFFYKRDSKITNRPAMKELFDGLQDGRYKIEVSSAKKRSTLQNAYFHGVVLDYVRQGLYDAGYSEVKTIADAKTVVKALFLKKDIVNHETGQVLTSYIQDTSALSTLEFSAFTDEVVRWAADYLGVTIPAPGQYDEMFI